jgi:rubredoxin
MSEKEESLSYSCIPCGYVYDPQKGDPDGGIPEGTPFSKLPEDWVCPLCGASHDLFEPIS